MAACVAHRGPDDSGVWVDETAGIALGHQRLAIIDTSPAGHQPMSSRSGRWVITYNGEIYNFGELRAGLEGAGVTFRGSSDTEVLVEAIDAWGLDHTLELVNGMFAFALWDRQSRRLHLARDRIGEKPLYYGRAGGGFVFGSELKALRAYPGFSSGIDRRAAALFLRYGYVPAPYTIYRGIYKLQPGCVVEVDASGTPSEPRAYWSLEQVVEAARRDPFRGDEREAADELDRLLQESVTVRMIADVPLGAFLSGGVDSSSVVAAMQTRATQPVRTFTIGFTDPTYDEADHARAIAQHLGTDHTEIQVLPDRALDLVARLPELYDEPFADPSALPTTLISEAAREHVTVCLSGDGGDELFGGYNRYTFGPSLWGSTRRLPRPIRRAAARGLLVPSFDAVSKAVEFGGRWLGRHRMPRMPATKLQKMADVLRADSEEELSRALVWQWHDPDALMIGERGSIPEQADGRVGGALPTSDRMMLEDCLTELPDDMLVKVDRASMSVGLETRLPLLDPRIVEFAWRLPPSMRIRGTEGKWLLRRALYRHVPRSLVDRPKMGFDPPLAAWLRGPLRSWAEELLRPDRLRENGLDPAAFRSRWDEHQRGRRNWDYALWTVLVLQSWSDHHHAVLA